MWGQNTSVCGSEVFCRKSIRRGAKVEGRSSRRCAGRSGSGAQAAVEPAHTPDPGSRHGVVRGEIGPREPNGNPAEFRRPSVPGTIRCELGVSQVKGAAVELEDHPGQPADTVSAPAGSGIGRMGHLELDERPDAVAGKPSMGECFKFAGRFEELAPGTRRQQRSDASQPASPKKPGALHTAQNVMVRRNPKSVRSVEDPFELVPLRRRCPDAEVDQGARRAGCSKQKRTRDDKG